MGSKRAIVLCADDFGMATGVDDAILDLARRGRLTATGCMVAGETFTEDAPRLTALSDRIDIGLHFALTGLPPLGPVPSLGTAEGEPATLGRVLTRALSGRLDYAEIAAEFGRQVGRFREVTGRAPAFVDGHQHVHLLPTVRKVVFDAFDGGLLDRRETWLRDCSDRPAAIVGRGVEVPKALFVSLLATGFGARARAHGILANHGFAGITAFEPGRFASLFPKFLAVDGDRPLVMCHPAEATGAAAGDPIAVARLAEYDHLSGDGFARDLERAGVRVARLREIAAAG